MIWTNVTVYYKTTKCPATGGIEWMTTAFLNALFKQVQCDLFRQLGKTEVKVIAFLACFS